MIKAIKRVCAGFMALAIALSSNVIASNAASKAHIINCGSYCIDEDGIYTTLQFGVERTHNWTVTPWSPSTSSDTGVLMPYYDLGRMLNHGVETYYRMPVSSEGAYVGFSLNVTIDKTSANYKAHNVGSLYSTAKLANKNCKFPELFLYRGNGLGLTADSCKTKVAALTGYCTNVNVLSSSNKDEVRFDIVVLDKNASTFNLKNLSYVLKNKKGEAVSTVMNYNTAPKKPSNIKVSYSSKSKVVRFSFTSQLGNASNVANGVICVKSKNTYSQASMQKYLYNRTGFTKEYTDKSGTNSFNFKFDSAYRYYIMVFPVSYRSNTPFFNNLYGSYNTASMGSAECYRISANSSGKVSYKKLGTVYMGKYRPVA